MKMKLLALMAFFVFTNSSAQDTLQLKLQDALAATLKNNREIVLATLDQQTSVAKFHQTKAAFLPHVNLSYAAALTDNPLHAFGFKLQQQSVSPSDFNPELLNNPAITKNFTTKVEWSQPLINIDMIYQRKAAEQQVDILLNKKIRTKEYLTFKVQEAYAQLQLSQHAVTVWQEGLRTANAVFESSKKYFEKGLLQKHEVLLAEVHVASLKSKVAEARSNVQNASDYISLLMGVEFGPVYSVEPVEIGKPSECLQQVPDERADFKALNSALHAQRLMIHSGRMSYLPKLNGFGTYAVNDKTVLGFGSKSWLVGAQVSWNLFDGTALHYRTAEQKSVYSRLKQQLAYQKEQAQLELNKTFRQFHDVRFGLQQCEHSVSQAAEALRILDNRFHQGLASTNDLLRSQTTLSEQKLLLNEAVFKFNTTLAFLQFLTSISEK